MRIALFCHSLLSDWNHGNAHFLRGVVTELALSGHEVRVFEPRDAWSMQHLLSEQGAAPIDALRDVYPRVLPRRYDLGLLDLDAALDGVDLVIVHEWNDPELIARVGAHHAAGGRYVLLFHDTHHRAITEPEHIRRLSLGAYDGVLAFGRALADVYATLGLARRVFTWHEAADTRVFHPIPGAPRQGDLVWIGNYGDGERAAELRTFLVDPVRDLGLVARVHGVRYPPEAERLFDEAGIVRAGFLPNHRVPEVFARHAVTVHVPRRPYVEALPGIPTIRPFEALACGIPLVSAPWSDVEHLFTPGSDYLVARTSAEMKEHLRAVLEDPALAASLARHGLATIRRRHTCAHRATELLAIAQKLGAAAPHEEIHAP